ncbi:hypothetical protein FRC06_006384 [Ceratobasidium sp. 370]|nr:hypothetical protein FRC06_006384 [Ceratobasidium sp. 370]
MTHASSATFGEGSKLARDPEPEMDDGEDADVRTEIGSPEMGIEEEELKLPPIRTVLPIQPYGPEAVSVGEQTGCVMRGGTAVSRNVLLYGPVGVTLAPTELAHNNACDKFPPIPSYAPLCQATFFGVQSVPMADGSGQFATICMWVSLHPFRLDSSTPPAGIAPLICLLDKTEMGRRPAICGRHSKAGHHR